MDDPTMRQLAASAPIGRLATVAADGTPHIVPVCFAMIGDVVYTAVDHKPKRTSQLKRLANVQATRYACLLVDHYDDDWSRLWWVRLDGRGRLVEDRGETSTALAALCGKYRQYAERPPEGPVLAVDTTLVTGWSAATR